MVARASEIKTFMAGLMCAGCIEAKRGKLEKSSNGLPDSGLANLGLAKSGLAKSDSLVIFIISLNSAEALC